jgi:hypothetical protein
VTVAVLSRSGSRVSDAALWWPIAAPPLAWLAGLEAGYALVPWACRTGARWAPLAVSLAALLVSLAAALVSGPRLATARGDGDDRTRGRRLLMIAAGLAFGIVFGLLSFTSLFPQLFLDPCASSS